MAKSKLEQLKVLSPLAAAIAFSAALPNYAAAANFVIKSQEELNDAVDAINADESEGSHSITFDSSLSGKHLTLNSFGIYGEGSLVIDGAGAKDLELGVLERKNNSGISLWGESSLTLQNLNIVEGANADDGYIVRGFEDSHITITNTNISGASLGSSYSSGVIEAEGLTIKDSSFNNLSGNSVIRINNYANNFGGEGEGDIDVSISNTTFTNNFNNKIINIYSNESGAENVELMISGVSFDSNETSGSAIKLRAESGYANDKNLEVSIANTSFTNNSSVKYGGIIDIDASSGSSSDYDANVTVNLANVTIANNLTNAAAIDLFSYDNSGEGEGGAKISLNMAHATIVNNGGILDEEAERLEFSGGFGLDVDAYNGELEVNILNSIITGNSKINGGGKGKIKGRLAEVTEAELEIVDGDIYSYVDISVNNTLVGVEYSEVEGESSIVGEGNLTGVDPMLGELMSDAKTGTMYMRPKSGSPAINAGTDENAAEVADILGVTVDELIDQLGNKRKTGSAPDMGAVEKGKKSSSSGVFGSLGFGSLLSGLALLGLRRKRK